MRETIGPRKYFYFVPEKKKLKIFKWRKIYFLSTQYAMLKDNTLDINVQVRGSSMDLKLKSRSSTSVAKECALPAIFQYWTREHHKRPLNSFQLEKSSTGPLKVQLLGILLIFERPLSPSRSGQEFLKPRTHLTED